MYGFKNIKKSFKDKLVLDDVSLSINNAQVIALIGENGAGKTTLLEILRGQHKPDAGTVQSSGDVGYVPQNATFKGTVQECFTAATESWQIQYALERVGLSITELHTPVETLSGGQKTRLSFATVLAQDPEPRLLLLDEPTNNLDTDGLAWLRTFIQTFNGAILLVSHDREFINDTATKIAELHNGKLKLYGGNYDFYIEQKAIEKEAAIQDYQQNVEGRNRLAKAIAQQREKGKHTHEHIKRSDGDKYQRDFFRNRVTTKFGQQARMLEKRLEQLDTIERPDFAKDYHVVLGGEVDNSKLVLSAHSISKSYNTPVLKNIDLEIRGNQRLHIQGKNGCGKSTLLKIIANISTADSGEIKYGTNIRYGYFSQETDGLDHAVTGLQNLMQTNADITNIFRQARSIGLNESDLKKPVHELSRGQQAKLGFAKLLLGTHHLLILDEPTNHLDIPTREQIESALQNYHGAILVASHDRYFVKSLGITHTINLEGSAQ